MNRLKHLELFWSFYPTGPTNLSFWHILLSWWHHIVNADLLFFVFLDSLLATLILFIYVIQKRLHLSVFVGLKATDLGLSRSPSLSVYPLLIPSNHPYPHAASSLYLCLSIHYSRLPEVLTFHVVLVCGATHLPYRTPIAILLQLWPPTPQPCSGQSTPPPPSVPAGVATNSRPWQGGS